MKINCKMNWNLKIILIFQTVSNLKINNLNRIQFRYKPANQNKMITGKKDSLKSNFKYLKLLSKIKINKNIHFGICLETQLTNKFNMTICPKDYRLVFHKLNAAI